VFDHILVPLDGSSLAEGVLPHVMSIAEIFDSRVTFLRVVERPSEEGVRRAVAPLRWQLRLTEAREYLAKLTNQLPELADRADSVIEEGVAAEKIIQYADTANINLIVLSSHGNSGLSEWNISSVVQKVVTRARMPTLIIRAYQASTPATQPIRYRKILVPVDGSPRAECVLPLLLPFAEAHQSEVFFVHVVGHPDVPGRMPLNQDEQGLIERVVELNRRAGSQYLQDLKSRVPLDVHTRLLVHNDVPMALHDSIDEESIDLVIISAHGQTGQSRWPYGSVALNLVTFGTTPLLIQQDLSPDNYVPTEAELAFRQQKGH